MDYHLCYYRRYKEIEDFKEQLRLLFVNALDAGGVGKIKEKAKSIRDFENKINEMSKCTYSELLHAFESNSYDELFESFKKFNQVGPKKAALFLRDIFYSKTISECPTDLKTKLLVPVDIVITRTINSLFDKKDILAKPFDKINELSKKEIFPEEPILLEDLWFWGRFYRCGEEDEKKDIPYCEFNYDLLEVDLNVTKEYRKKLLEFANNHRNCPFKEICTNTNIRSQFYRQRP